MKKTIALLLALILVTPLLFSVRAAAAEDETAFLSQPGVKLGVEGDTVHALLVEELFPDAEIFYYDKFAGYTAVAQGKLDAFIYDKMQLELAVANGQKGVRVLDETLGESVKIAVGISNDSGIPELEEKINAFIGEIKADGTLDDMFERWVAEADYAMPEIEAAASPEYHLKVGTNGAVEPYSFYEGDTLTGYDIELMLRFAAWLDADVEFQTFDWGAIVAAAQSGRVDIIASDLQITPERAEAITFSDVLFEEETGIMVRDTGAAADTQAADVRWQDYNGKRIGVLTGTLMEDAAETYFPDSEYLYFNSYPDCNAALLAGKIDAYLGDEPGLKTIHAEQPAIDYIHERITNQEYSFAFRKDDPESAALCEKLNAFLAKIREDGTLQEIDDIWFGVDEDRKVVDMSDLTGENGTIRVITTSTDMPFSYIKDGRNVGYDIDLVVRFCRDRGYSLELGDVDFAGRIPAIQSGKYDFTTDMNVTPERQEEVLFSDPTSTGGIVLAVLASDLEAEDDGTAENASDGQGTFIERVRTSFQKTFIREERYKLFLSGILTTLLITVLSILFGTALGFLVYLGCRNGNRAANGLAGFLVWLVQGMPVVVLLMILYYIIFAKSAISGTTVAVIAFTLVFGSGVFGMLKSGVGAVDKGQAEAAYALGYGNLRTFFRIILPQAVPHFLPAYKGEVVALIKATAVVGYIAVQDLTKMGDIVRGRTYEAFFPLIAVAVIYFILGGLLTFLVGRVEINVDPKRRKKEDILKGVRTDD